MVSRKLFTLISNFSLLFMFISCNQLEKSKDVDDKNIKVLNNVSKQWNFNEKYNIETKISNVDSVLLVNFKVTSKTINIKEKYLNSVMFGDVKFFSKVAFLDKNDFTIFNFRIIGRGDVSYSAEYFVKGDMKRQISNKSFNDENNLHTMSISYNFPLSSNLFNSIDSVSFQ